MSPQTENENGKVRNNWIAGIALIAIGLLLIANQIFDLPSFGQLILPLLAAIFLGWGLVTREGGLLIPGGILGGIGAGVILMSNGNFEGEGQAGIFMLTFAAGWALITLLSFVVRPVMWWPLIPGGIIAAVGAALLLGGQALNVLEVVGRFWPVVLILLGAWIIVKRRE